MLLSASRAEAELVGRTDELGIWSSLADRLVRGGSTLVILGEPGVGKSRLLRQLCRQAGDRGMRVLHASCSETGTASAYLPLIAVLAPLSRPGGALSGDLPSALRPAVETVTRLWDPGPEPAPLDDGPVVAESVVRTLGLLAGSAGLVLAVDDVQWSDPDTVAVLEYLARTVDSSRVLLIVAAVAGRGADAVVTRLTRASTSHLLRLPRLVPEEESRLVRSLLGDDAPSEVIDAVSARAEGLPLAVEEVVDDLLRSGAVQRRGHGWLVRPELLDEATSPSLEEAVRTRLAEVDPDAEAVATAVALRDDDSTWEQVVEITGQSADAAAGGLQDLADVGLLVSTGRGRHRYRHGLIREAVLRCSRPSLVQSQARRAASLLHERAAGEPTGLTRAAALWTLAGRPDPAARDLLTAARGWLGRGAVATAVTAARTAHEAAPTAALRAEAADVLTDALTRSGHFREALGLMEEALRLPGSPGAVHCRAARCSMEVGQRERAYSHLRDAELAGGVLPEVLALRASLAFEGNDLDAARVLGERAVVAAEDARDAGMLASALLLQARVLRAGDPGDAIPGLERLLQLARETGMASLHERGMLEIGLVDRLTTNRADRLQEARRLADERGSLHTLAVAELNLWPTLAEGGDLDLAEQLCHHSVEVSARHQLRTLLPARVMLVIHEALRGRLEGAAEAAESLRGTPFHAGALLYLELLAGHHRAALDAVGPAAETLNRPPDARAAPARGFHALLAAVLENDSGPADDLIDRGIGAWYNRGLARLAQAVVAGRRGDVTLADSAAASGFADLVPFPTLAAIATTVVAEEAAVRGWGEPASWLTAARAQADLLGNRRMRELCDAALRNSGLPVPRRGRGDTPIPPNLRRMGVTTREMDVLALVAERLTNTQIAERLSVSPRTVDTHVSRLIAKAGVTDRRGLASLLDPHAG